MTADEIIKLVRPEHLVYFEVDLQNAQGEIRVPKGSLAGIKLKHYDSWGYERPVMCVTQNDLAGKVRCVTEDEIRAWIRMAE